MDIVWGLISSDSDGSWKSEDAVAYFTTPEDATKAMEMQERPEEWKIRKELYRHKLYTSINQYEDRHNLECIAEIQMAHSESDLKLYMKRMAE